MVFSTGQQRAPVNLFAGVALEHNWFAAKTQFAHPMRQGRVQVVGMTWKPFLKFRGQGLAMVCLSMLHLCADFSNAF